MPSRQLVGRRLEPLVQNLGCFPAHKVHISEKRHRNRGKLAVRPIFFGFSRIFGIVCRRRRVVSQKIAVFRSITRFLRHSRNSFAAEGPFSHL